MGKAGRPRKPRVYKKIKAPTGFPPVTSAKALVTGRTKINATNRQRSQAMEKRVAVLLKGRRIPMSGAAAAFKGDVEVLFDNYPGKYLIECKLSAQLGNTTKEPFIRLQFNWFTKIAEEARNMNAKFGVVIIHYKGINNDYVMVKHSIIERLMTQYESPMTDILQQLLIVSPVMDMRLTKAGKPRAGFDLQRKDIEAGMVAVNGFKGVTIRLPDDDYLVIHISTWKQAVNHM